MTQPDPDVHARRLAAESLAEGDSTGWFERLYAAAAAGEATVPWSRGEPNRFLVEWTTRRLEEAERSRLDGQGRRAVVVGCGLGDDAEHIAGLGFDTTAFDVAPGAVRAAQQRFPDSAVRYRTADLLDLPDEWRRGFDLVVESMTVQSLPVELRREAIRGVARLVAPGGTLIVIAFVREESIEQVVGPPWPLSREEIDAFAAEGLRPVRVERLDEGPRWRAEFQRP